MVAKIGFRLASTLIQAWLRTGSPVGVLLGQVLNSPTCGVYLQLDADAAGLPHPGDLGPQFDMLMQELQGGVGIGGHEDGMHEGRKSTKPACLFLFLFLLHQLCPGFTFSLHLAAHSSSTRSFNKDHCLLACFCSPCL